MPAPSQYASPDEVFQLIRERLVGLVSVK